MIRLATRAIALAAVASTSALAVDVGTCEQFAAVDRKTETEVTITTAEFTCDEYTRLSIRTDMVLKSSVGAVTFSNLALKVYGSLTVEPDVVFTGITLAEKNGGALKVELGAVGVFQGTAEFSNCTIITTDLTYVSEDGEYFHDEIQRKGGAIHNKGTLTFEKDATFTGNVNNNVEYGSGPGGAISNHVKGTMIFMGKLTMTDNEADDYFGGAEGGAFYNGGDVVVEGEALFNRNRAGRGGAIYQDKWGTFVFNSFADFTENMCIDSLGGAIANFGGKFDFNMGSMFFDNFAENSGDGGTGGGIYNENGGIVTLTGPTSFIQNYGNWGGGIANRLVPSEYAEHYTVDSYKTPVITYPEDTIFQDNYGQYCNDVFTFEDNCGL